MGKESTIKKILLMDSGEIFYIKDLDKDYHTQYGFVTKADLNKKQGSTVETNKGTKMALLSPTFIDMYKKIKRAPQIVTRKDIGLIIAETGIDKNSKVLDAGAGSGGMCCFLGHIVKKVISYEIRDDFYDIAKSNVEFLGLKNVMIKKKSIYEPVQETDIDLVTLDVPEPWRAVDAVLPCVNVGGFIVSYSPTVPQVIDFTEAVKKRPELLYVGTTEILQRDWVMDGRRVRPDNIAIGHSGFITFVRKVA